MPHKNGYISKTIYPRKMPQLGKCLEKRGASPWTRKLHFHGQEHYTKSRNVPAANLTCLTVPMI